MRIRHHLCYRVGGRLGVMDYLTFLAGALAATALMLFLTWIEERR